MNELAETIEATVAEPYAVYRRGQGMRWTDAFLSRYGYVLGRPVRPARPAPRVPRGTVAAWVREAQERQLQRLTALSKGGRIVQQTDWKPPMTGADLADRRKRANLSQRDLAKAAEISRGLIASMETGGRQASPQTWQALVIALHRAEAGELAGEQ